MWARTWPDHNGGHPPDGPGQGLHRREKTGWSLTAAGRRLHLWGCEPEGRWEQTSSAHQAALPGVGRLPITLRRETWREYALTSVPLNREAAQTLLQQRLLVHLKDVIGPEGEIVTADYAAQVEGGSLKVTLLAECREEIGRDRRPGLSPTAGAGGEWQNGSSRGKHLKRAEKEHILNLFPSADGK